MTVLALFLTPSQQYSRSKDQYFTTAAVSLVWKDSERWRIHEVAQRYQSDAAQAAK